MSLDLSGKSPVRPNGEQQRWSPAAAASSLVSRLAQHCRVVSLDRSCPAEPPPGVDCAEIDLTSDEGVRAALHQVHAHHGHRVASVIHLAAYFDLEGKPHPDYERVTVRGTERLLRELRSAFEVEQFVFASTMLVHAPRPPGQRIDEDAPVAPDRLPAAWRRMGDAADSAARCQRRRRAAGKSPGRGPLHPALDGGDRQRPLRG